MNIKENKNVLSNTFMQKIMMVVFVVSSIAFWGIINPTEIKAQAAEPVEPVEPANEQLQCDELVQSSICDCGFTSWGEPWVSTIMIDRCPVTVLYRHRNCRCDYDIVEVEILEIKLDLSYRWRRCPIFCSWIYPCRDKLRYLTAENPKDATERKSDFELQVFRVLTEQLFREHVNELIKIGDLEVLPWCNAEPDNPNGPVTDILVRRGSCRGWCFTQQPDPDYFLEKYRWDIDKLPNREELAYLLYAEENDGKIPPSSIPPVEIELLNEKELAELDAFVQTEIVPYLPEEMIADGGMLRIDAVEKARFIWTPKKCAEDFCCVTKETRCVERVVKLGKTYHPIIRNTSETIMGENPTCSGYPSQENCPRGKQVDVYKCKNICEDNIPIHTNPQQTNSIVESFKGIQILPNPTSNGTTLILEILTSGNLTITLVDISGKELLKLHNATVEVGTFTKNFTMSKLPKGVYYLRISHNNNVKMEKVMKD